MGFWWRQLVTLAGQSATELLRSPATALLYLAALLLAGLLPQFDYLSFLDKRRLVADSLLAMSICAGVLAAATGAAAVVGDDLRRRTALLVMSRPVSRSQYLFGRWLGLALGLAPLAFGLAVAVLWGSRVAVDDYRPDALAARVYLAVWLAGLLLAGGVNFFAGRSFCSAAVGLVTAGLGLGFLGLGLVGYRGQSGTGWGLVDWAQAPAAAAAYPAMVLAAAVAVAAATRWPAAGVLLVTLVVFVVGLISDYLSWRMGPWGWPFGWLWPSWQPFWLADPLAASEAMGWTPVGRAAAYSFAWSAGLLAAVSAVFGRRELG